MFAEIRFVCLDPGAMFCFRNATDVETYDQESHKWIEYGKIGSGSRIWMKMYCLLEAYTKPTAEEIRFAVKEDLNNIFKKVYRSVNNGYLTIGYYDNPIGDQVGYLHSSTPLSLFYSFKEKNIPPPWLNLKAFW